MSPNAKGYPLTLNMAEEEGGKRAVNLLEIADDVVVGDLKSPDAFVGRCGSRKRPSNDDDDPYYGRQMINFRNEFSKPSTCASTPSNSHFEGAYGQHNEELNENARYTNIYRNVHVKEERTSPDMHPNPGSNTPNDPNYSPLNSAPPAATDGDFLMGQRMFDQVKPEPQDCSPQGFHGQDERAYQNNTIANYYGRSDQPSSSTSFDVNEHGQFEDSPEFGYPSSMMFEDFSTREVTNNDESQVEYYMNLVARRNRGEIAVKEETSDIEDEEDDEDTPSSSYIYGDGKVCTVCGYKCPHKNYGVYCCNACAAFFRRTIKQSRSYVCVKGRKCRVDFGGHKRTCRYCRFKRCVMAGMSIDYVMTRADDFMIDSAPDNDIIKQISSWFTSTFVNRFRSFEKSFSNGTCKSIVRGEGTLNNTLHSMFVEFDVMRTYINTTGLRRYIKEKDEFVLTKRLFYKWLFVQCVFNTLRHGGHRQNRVYLVDDSSLPLEAKSHEQYVRSIPHIKNPKIVAKSHYSLMQQGMDDVWMFHHANIDGNDFAIFNHLICLRTIREMYPQNKEIQTEMNSIFKASHQYYKSVFKDFPTRMGNLVLLMNESEMFTLKFKEWVVLMTLNGVRSALEMIEDHWVSHGNYNVYDVLLNYFKAPA